MKNHVWRPLFIVLAIVIGILALRTLLVPSDFGAHERGYMYGWHRKSNEAEWKKYPVKYKTSATCRECHQDKCDDIKDSPHGSISCENCHGPRYNHPEDPVGLNIDRSRALCIRCHAYLPYKESGRGKILGIDPEKHHPRTECIMCHYPHDPTKSNPKYRKTEVKS